MAKETKTRTSGPRRDNARQKTDREYADDLEEWLDGTRIRYMIVDPSAASFIAELRKRGISVLKAKNEVEDGIRVVGTKLNQGKLLFSDECQNTIKEFASYVWDEKAAESGIDKPVKLNDHCMDALRYFAYTVLNDQKAIIRNKNKAGFH